MIYFCAIRLFGQVELESVVGKIFEMESFMLERNFQLNDLSNYSFQIHSTTTLGQINELRKSKSMNPDLNGYWRT